MDQKPKNTPIRTVDQQPRPLDVSPAPKRALSAYERVMALLKLKTVQVTLLSAVVSGVGYELSRMTALEKAAADNNVTDGKSIADREGLHELQQQTNSNVVAARSETVALRSETAQNFAEVRQELGGMRQDIGGVLSELRAMRNEQHAAMGKPAHNAPVWVSGPAYGPPAPRDQ